MTINLEESKGKIKPATPQSLHKRYFRGNLNPAFYWKQGLDRCISLGNDRAYMADHQLYSNYIYENSQKIRDWKLFGSLTLAPTGQVLNFLDYRFVMSKVRYLNKSFLALTQSYCNYMPEVKKEAVMKVSLYEVYEGKQRMPILRHPYYTNCSKLKILYQKCEKKDVLCKSKTDYDKMFFVDLFEVCTLFPELKRLKVAVSHSHRYVASLTW